jgi:hypothetical protein
VKLVVPYTYIHQPTVDAIPKWLYTEWRYVGDDGDAYLDLFQVWLSEREPFILCEHDVVPGPQQFKNLLHCPHEWCAYLYREEQRTIGPPLGFCRFREPWLEANQHLFDDFIRGESWTRLNRWVNDHAVGTPHLHGPPWVRNDSRRPVPAV